MAIALREIIEAEDLEDDRNPVVPFVYGYDEEGYLVSDGQPIAENSQHRRETNNAIESLDAHFSVRADVYVSGCDFIHYKRGDRTRYISPDGYVVFGATKRNPNGKLRKNFKVWEEGDRFPAIIFEFTSNETKGKDQNDKFLLYEQTFKTPEYVLFDPQSEYLHPNLQTYRLNAEGRYTPIAPNEDGRIYSESLDLYLESSGGLLRFFDAKTGEYLRSPAEAEAERLREKRRADDEKKRADEEKRRAEREARGRRQEKKRADEAEAEIAALRAQLDALRR